MTNPKENSGEPARGADPGGFTDIPTRGWIAERAPGWARPYLRLARLDRPIGTWLLLWPCWWSLALASGGRPDPVLLVLFALGALVMRGAGCAWNDITDRNYDGRVERTRGRPIPAGELTVVRAAGFMVLLALIGLAVLLTFNRFAVWIGAASLLPVVIYPFMKRITWWPQFFLGLAFNWGALLGWAAVRGSLDWPALVLYVGGIAWTLGYDTI
ncbi:MAG TPA: UbiA family prenyltransferase, partial [Alphaproteobacteria bacterium]|nr:UbiA family prenyltransferase [Alphaproteobacteria bacterium]